MRQSARPISEASCEPANARRPDRRLRRADILHGVDLDVAEGEIVTLAGTNGAGKSTVVKAIMGLLPVVRGRITLDGHDLARVASEDRIRLGIAYVPQVANVFPSLTVAENLQVVEGVADRRRRLAEMLAIFPALAERRRRRPARCPAASVSNSPSRAPSCRSRA